MLSVLDVAFRLVLSLDILSMATSLVSVWVSVWVEASVVLCPVFAGGSVIAGLFSDFSFFFSEDALLDFLDLSFSAFFLELSFSVLSLAIFSTFFLEDFFSVLSAVTFSDLFSVALSAFFSTDSLDFFTLVLLSLAAFLPIVLSVFFCFLSGRLLVVGALMLSSMAAWRQIVTPCSVQNSTTAS